MRIKTLTEAKDSFEVLEDIDQILGGKAIDMSEGTWYYDPTNIVQTFDDNIFLNAGYFQLNTSLIDLDGNAGYFNTFKFQDSQGNLVNVALGLGSTTGYDPVTGYMFINQTNISKMGEDENNYSIYCITSDVFSGYLSFNDKSNKSLYSANEFVSSNSGYTLTSVNAPPTGGNYTYSYDTTKTVLVENYKDVYFDNISPNYIDVYKSPVIKEFSSTVLTSTLVPSESVFADLSEYSYGLQYWKAHTTWANDPDINKKPFESPLNKEIKKLLPNVYSNNNTSSLISNYSDFGAFYRNLADQLYNNTSNSYLNSFNLSERTTILQMIQILYLDSGQNWTKFVNYVEKWDGNKKLY